MKEQFIMTFPDGTCKVIDITPDFTLSKVIKDNPTCVDCYIGRCV